MKTFGLFVRLHLAAVWKLVIINHFLGHLRITQRFEELLKCKLNAWKQFKQCIIYTKLPKTQLVLHK